VTAARKALAIRYTERLAEAGVVNSVRSKGDCDNAMAESFNGLYKTELIRRQGPWKNIDHVEWANLTYIDWFNNRRIHDEIGEIPPAEFEESYYRQTTTYKLVSSQTNESP
jgi:putative transposase